MASNSKRALITGITGQDGSYLSEFLLSKGYEVHGIVRHSSTFNTDRIDHLYTDPHEVGTRLFLHYGDLTDGTVLRRVLEAVRPEEIYNLGAQSHVRISFEEPEYTADVDALGMLRLLESARDCCNRIGMGVKIYQAGSSEMFGMTRPAQTEQTAFYPRSLYGVAKLAAHWFGVNYPTEVDHLLGDSSKARKILGWKPTMTFQQLVTTMVDHDIEQAAREQTVRGAGYSVVLPGEEYR